MIVTTTANLEGVDEIVAMLRQLPPNVAGKLVKPAMMEAGNLLKERTSWEAHKQLQGAEGRGYKRKKPGPHLYTTAAARVKTYRKGDTTFVAVGFDYRAGGRHAHLVELGHRIVTGGTLKGRTASGKRFVALFGSTKFAPGGATKEKDEAALMKAWGRSKRLRGGGRLSGGKTREFPMLRPAFEAMKRPMLIAIELELRKIESLAQRLVANTGTRKHWWGTETGRPQYGLGRGFTDVI